MAIDVFQHLKPSSMALMKSFDTHGTIIILVDSHFVVIQGNEWLLFFHNPRIKDTVQGVVLLHPVGTLKSLFSSYTYEAYDSEPGKACAHTALYAEVG
jgi:hypothetical protein